MSLRARLALVIALLAFLPNLVLALTLGALGEGPWPPLLLWLFLLALLSGLVGYFLAKSLLRPLEELTRALAYLSLKEGPLEALRLPTPKEPPPEEIALLRARFSELLARLKELLEAREALYAALAHDLDVQCTFRLFPDGTGDGRGPTGTRHDRFRTWKEDLRDHA